MRPFSPAPAPSASSATGEARPLLTMSGIAKRFDSGTVALAGLNLAVEAGSLVSLLGPSGCGKSTVLRLVAGLASPTEGKLAWSEPQAASARTGRVSYVFQEPTLLPWANLLANVALPLRLAGISRNQAETKGLSALAAVGLAGFAAAYPRELSGGMKMRVSLARALVTEPELLLLDEPFAALDEITRFKLASDVFELWRGRRFTAIFVTHSIFESVYLSQRVVVMAPRPGRVVADLAVDSADERDERFRLSTEYASRCQIVADALQGAMTS